MSLAKPSLGLLRSLTDEHVLNALVAAGRLTRAELAARTGISKPTIAESVRRLTDEGLLQDTGERSTGRGRAGSYFALADDLGTALVVEVTASGIVVERIELSGATLARADENVPDDLEPAGVAAALARAAERAIGDSGPARLAVVSAADPVDRATGRLVELPDSPFLVGELDPPAVLAPYVSGSVTVDNDVHWAARAELEHGGPADFGYLYLGAGLGGAIVSDGAVRPGRSGIAGEVSHVITVGPDGRAMPFTEVFEHLGLHRPGSSAIDVDQLLRRLTGDDPDSARTTAAVATAISGVLVTMISLLDPELIIIGGSWGTEARLLTAVADRLQTQPRRAPIRAAATSIDAPLTAVRAHARSALSREVLARP
ncbi:ROK family transcriptional regulator [Microlunatus speluncae]|uniref:ROK family transcriptional regulator n=1 Tax=Microlunatus speluncae TaxID=2594267 RepID=UPI0012666E0B|nr:ROK family transcriptional regulator [Microlunatus speluncae]